MGETEEILTLEKALRTMSSELKQALGEAKMESQRLETILNSMSEAVIATDDKLMLLLINPCARKLFNLENRNDRKKSLLELTHSTELEWTARKALETGNPVETEITLCANGADKYFNVSVSPIFLQTESAGGIVMVMEDQTRIIRLEQVRKDFVANVSHELRTPIQLIKGFSETLLEYASGQEPHEQFNHYIEIIRKNAGTMENLINDLLSLASLEDEESFRQAKEELELLPLFTEALSLVELQARKKQINIAVDCDLELKAKLYGSYTIQILVNLLDNAIKYSPEAAQIWACAFYNGNELVLEVKDQGIGIPVEHQARIFERFYRVDKARSREVGGTGLGLSIVRHLVLLHGGRVELESHAGEGSVFRVFIP
jgi:two-component system phosphate regulon sensor histidine kinase PhoR